VIKKLMFIVGLVGSLFASTPLKPVDETNINAAVLDMVLANGKIYIATDASKVLILDNNFTILQTIPVRQIKDFMGDLNDADIYSIDVLGDTILYLAQAEDGYSELFLYKDGKKINVLDKSKMVYAKAAKFVDKDRAVLALMSDEVLLYDLKKRAVIKKTQAGEYFYSVMAMSKDRKYIAIGDEGGEVIIIDPKTLQRVKVFKDVNKDKILSISIDKEKAVAGSRADKAFAIYDIKTGDHKVIKNPNFFVYVTGINADNGLAVYGDNEKYILKVVDVTTLELLYTLVGHKNIVNVVRFIDNSTILTGSETGEIKRWRLE